MVIRLLLLEEHYRTAGSGTTPACPGATERLDRWRAAGEGAGDDAVLEQVRAALDDDLDLPTAVAAVDAAAARGEGVGAAAALLGVSLGVSATGIQLVVSDLDGTFWHLDHEVHPATRAAVDELARRGVSLLVATGRRLRHHRGPARPHRAHPAGGRAQRLPRRRPRLRRPVPHAPDRHRRGDGDPGGVPRRGLEPCVYVDHAEIEVYLAPEPGTHPQHAANLAPQADVDDLARVVAEEVVLGFSILGRPFEVLQPVVDRLDGAGVPHLDKSIEYVGQASLTVTQPGISKWEGVVAWCRHAGIDPGAVLAIGDGPNDVELLEGAAVAVAPADSHESALALADHVVGPATDGGWADLLDIVA